MKHEKALKKILSIYETTSTRTFSSKGVDITRIQLEYLSSWGFISISPYEGNSGDVKITVENSAIIYFDEKKDKLFRFWLPIIISVAALIISIISISLSATPTVQEVKILS